MKKELTDSQISRQNILNNHVALTQVEAQLDLGGINWHEQLIFTKQQVAQILQVDIRTIERYLERFLPELQANGYQILKGERLKAFKKEVTDINVGDILKAPSLSLFTFKTVLNLAMLITESERAKEIRSKILDIVLDVISKKTGGQTKYINQRDESYLMAAYEEHNYRKFFTEALKLKIIEAVL